MTALQCNHLMIKSGEGIDFVSGHYLKTQKLSVMEQHILNEITMYEKRGFKVVGIHVDGQFDTESFKNKVIPTTVYVYAPGEHVSFIENSNKTVKERMRSVVHGLPYDQVPRIVVISLVQHVVGHLNYEKKKGRSMSTTAIVTGRGKRDFSMNKIKFGAYAQVWGGTTNILKARSVGCIALHSLNEEGGYHFLSLKTGKVVKSDQWKELPITDDVKHQVEHVAKWVVTKETMMEYINLELQNIIGPEEEAHDEVASSPAEDEVIVIDVIPQEANANHQDVDDVQFEDDDFEFRPHIIPLEGDTDNNDDGASSVINITDETNQVSETANSNVIVEEDMEDDELDGVSTMEVDENENTTQEK